MLITLHGKHGDGKFAIVDAADYARLSKFRWKVSGKGYVYREMRPYEGVRGARAMHHEVLGITDPDRKRPVDHENLNKLDNRRSNLRRTTPAVNLTNRRVYANSKTGHRFVHPGPIRSYGPSWLVVPPRPERFPDGTKEKIFRSLEAAIEAALPFQERRAV